MPSRKRKKNNKKTQISSPLANITDNITTEEPVADDISSSENELISNEAEQVENRLNDSGILSKELIAEVKKLVTAEVIADFKDDKVLKDKELELRREVEDMEYQTYVASRMESDDPWVDFVGDIRDTSKGQRLQMNWNPAFIVFLRSIGITGQDEEHVVQRYISLLLQDMVDKDENRYGSDYQ